MATNDQNMDTELLTSVLCKNGHLGDAIVQGVELTPFETVGIASAFYAARLTYSSDNHELPRQMVIKRPLVGDRGQGEANVYELILKGSNGLPLMNYFGVVDEHPDKPLSMLFEDLSDSHDQTPWPIIPSLDNCQQAVATIAHVHAHWWGKASTIDATPPVAVLHNPAHIAAFFSDFIGLVSGYLSPDRIASYENIFANLDTLVGNRLSSENATLLHADSHFWNFMYPKDPERDHCVIYDWPLWRTGLAGSDLAYMIALHLYPEHRSRFEPILLEHYCHVLQERGVAYELADIRLDYRIGVIIGLLMPIMEFSWKNPPMSWMPKLEKGFAAYDDLNCQELLEAV